MEIQQIKSKSIILNYIAIYWHMNPIRIHNWRRTLFSCKTWKILVWYIKCVELGNDSRKGCLCLSLYWITSALWIAMQCNVLWCCMRLLWGMDPGWASQEWYCTHARPSIFNTTPKRVWLFTKKRPLNKF